MKKLKDLNIIPKGLSLQEQKYWLEHNKKQHMNFLKQIFCYHRWRCIYKYGTFADWRCRKCGKIKRGLAPIYNIEVDK